MVERSSRGSTTRIVDRAPLGDAEIGAVRLEVGVEVGGGGLGGADEALRVHLQVADRGALHLVAVRALDLLVGDVERLRQHVAELLHQELAAAARARSRRS